MSESDFNSRRDRLIREIDRAGEIAVADMLRRLEELRQELRDHVAGYDLNNIGQMRQAQAQAEADIGRFQIDATRELQADLAEGWVRGQEAVTSPLKTMFSVSGGGISNETLTIAQNFSADLIQGISSEIRTKINSILRQTVLGGFTMREALAEIGSTIDRGAFKSVAARAEAIVRTEVLRIHSQATQLQMENQNKSLPEGYELLKGWLATHDARVRPAHLAAEFRYQDNPIAVDEPFIVDGEELMYPRDETGSPENTINCRCVSVPVIRRQQAQKAA